MKAIGAKIIECDTFKMSPTQDQSELRIFLDKKKPFIASVAYVELGCEVQDAAYSKLRNLRRTKEGFVIATAEQRTSIPGLFAVGDCVNLLGQISVASGQAAVAATTIHNDLFEEK